MLDHIVACPDELRLRRFARRRFAAAGGAPCADGGMRTALFGTLTGRTAELRRLVIGAARRETLAFPYS